MNAKRCIITDKGQTDGTWYYGWAEVEANYVTGADQTPLAFARGTLLINPAVEVNNNEVDVGTIVYVRQRGYVAGQLWFEFEYTPKGGALPIVQAMLASDYLLTFSSAWETLPDMLIDVPTTGRYIVSAQVSVQTVVSGIGLPAIPHVHFYVGYSTSALPVPDGSWGELFAGGVCGEGTIVGANHQRTVYSRWLSTFDLQEGAHLSIQMLKDSGSAGGAFTTVHVETFLSGFSGNSFLCLEGPIPA